MIKAPPTPKGFRDINPELAQKRRLAINKIIEVLEQFEFDPIETPIIEFASTLKGKYGEEEKLIYEFKDRGGRQLALRYDLTVPLARYVATYNPKLPFRRYQIGQVFRGENPQHGRYREFTQLDFDTVGSSDVKEDARIIACAIRAVKAAGLANPIMAINDRKNFEDIPQDVVRSLDKLHKIGRAEVENEIEQRGYSKQDVGKYIEEMLNAQKTDKLKEIFLNLHEYGLSESHDFFFESSLARGLDYYTGAIFELKPSNDPVSLSIGAGGRYDNLIGMFVHPGKDGAKKSTPAVGFSFGLDRLIETI
ncbi:histidine--tRNA ligase [Candidatus Curtissbacteria bacterium]|nr:histidine--tRNA ligase [Candidatus Curtissbacteria bacterium]